jgi:hypothetical protein
MKVGEDVFFREAILRMCSSLDIVEVLKSCFECAKLYVPINMRSPRPTVTRLRQQATVS